MGRNPALPFFLRHYKIDETIGWVERTTGINLSHLDNDSIFQHNHRNMKTSNETKCGNALESAIRQINASCPEPIDSEMLVSCIKGKTRDKKWKPQVYSFLEELPVAMIHDVALSGILTFEELSGAVDQWECLDGPTTDWIREMAALGVEMAAGNSEPT